MQVIINTFILINLNNIITMNKEQEIEEKIKDLTRQIEYNNTANERMQNQINSLREDIMILEKPKILESDLEIMVQDLTEMVSGIFDDMSQNIGDYDTDFEIGYNNEVSISNICLDYDATEDIKTYLQTRFYTVVPDQTENIN
tara:strand:+ start:1570 stop:1998 length:429 start_codon:yes stop_codon:yes gene_type:complete